MQNSLALALFPREREYWVDGGFQRESGFNRAIDGNNMQVPSESLNIRLVQEDWPLVLSARSTIYFEAVFS